LDISKTADYLKYLTKDQKFLYLLFDIICHKELIKEITTEANNYLKEQELKKVAM
jgi:hypothetical protein